MMAMLVDASMRAYFIAVTALAMVFWVALVLQSLGLTNLKEKKGIVLAYMPGAGPSSIIAVFLITPHLTLFATSTLSNDAGHKAACLCASAWVVSVTVNEVLKNIFGRQRPASIAQAAAGSSLEDVLARATLKKEAGAAEEEFFSVGDRVVRVNARGKFPGSILASHKEAGVEPYYTVSVEGEPGLETQTDASRLWLVAKAEPKAEPWLAEFRARLQAAKRHLPQLQVMMRDPSTAFASFPSGDAAGAASIATTASLLHPDLMGVWVGVACIAAFGRVYFHAHVSSLLISNVITLPNAISHCPQHVLDVTIGELVAVVNTLLVFHLAMAGSWLGFVGLQLGASAVFGALKALKTSLKKSTAKKGLAKGGKGV